MSQRIYARKCQIKTIDYNISKLFLETNHLQGSCISKINLGLYYKDELVSVMTFGGLRKNLGSKAEEGSWELLRFCNKLNTTIVGGAQKLFVSFINTYRPQRIISYADRCWTSTTQTTLYDRLNFRLLGVTKPNYFYINSKEFKRENRFNYRKDILVKEGYDSRKSEKEIMSERGFLRIYNSGQLKYEWTPIENADTKATNNTYSDTRTE